MKKKQKITLKQTLPYILIAGSAVGILSSFILLVENIHLLEHPTQQLVCDINPIISCGSVMKTWQSQAFGFPNPIVGLLGFAFLGTVGLGMLAGATFKKWFWWLVQAAVTGSLAFTLWFQYESLTSINALCPFCVLVWIVAIPMFLYTTLFVLREKYITLPKRLEVVNTFAQKQHDIILAAWYVAIVLMILNHFWYYWQTLI